MCWALSLLQNYFGKLWNGKCVKERIIMRNRGAGDYSTIKHTSDLLQYYYWNSIVVYKKPFLKTVFCAAKGWCPDCVFCTGGSLMKAAGTEESRPTDMENSLIQTEPLLHRGQRVGLQGWSDAPRFSGRNNQIQMHIWMDHSFQRSRLNPSCHPWQVKIWASLAF